MSGVAAARPGLAALLDACRRHELDAVIVARLDRFGRSLRHLSAALGELDDLGVQFVSAHDTFDSAEPSGRLHRNILSSFAQFEREQFLERTRSGLRAKAGAGWWPGGPPPFGYRLVRDGRHHRLEVDEREADAIRLAVSVLVDERGTTADAARTLNALGFRPRRAARWRYNHLRRFLLDAQLTGEWIYGRQAGRGRRRVPGANPGVVVSIPPILTPERQLALFERLEASRIPRQSTNERRRYLLSGGMLRSPCGYHFHGLFHTGSGRRKYVCPGRRHHLDDACICRTVDAESIEELIWASVVSLLTKPSRLARCRSGQPIALVGETVDLDDLIAAADEVVGETTLALAHGAVELVRSGLPAAAIAVATQELQDAVANAEAARSRLLVERHEATDSTRLAHLERQATVIEARLADFDDGQRRALLEMLAVEATVTHWTPCPLCDAKGKLRGGKGGLRCPACLGTRHTPAVTSRAWWSEAVVSLLTPTSRPGGPRPRRRMRRLLPLRTARLSPTRPKVEPMQRQLSAARGRLFELLDELIPLEAGGPNRHGTQVFRRIAELRAELPALEAALDEAIAVQARVAGLRAHEASARNRVPSAS
jgi:DNA invertase Pin-like site-specific DNA recombinase